MKTFTFVDNNIYKFINTSFFDKFVEKVYLYKKDPDILCFSHKNIYSTHDFNQVINELGISFPYILIDKDDLENGYENINELLIPIKL